MSIYIYIKRNYWIKKDNVDNCYYFCYIEPFIVKMGQNGTQSNLNKSIVENYILSIPLNIKEQSAIANVLSSMDDEIQKQIENRDKYIEEKQGLMQVLLTGKKRI